MFRVAAPVLAVAVAVAGCHCAPRTPVAPAAPVAVEAKGQRGLVVLDSAPSDALVFDVRVTRTRCTITHPIGLATADLFVPVGRAIKLHVTSGEPDTKDYALEVSIVDTHVRHTLSAATPVDIAFRADAAGAYSWYCPRLVPGSFDSHIDIGIVSGDAHVTTFAALAPSSYDALLTGRADPNDTSIQTTVSELLPR
jgi:hypothetical protein